MPRHCFNCKYADESAHVLIGLTIIKIVNCLVRDIYTDDTPRNDNGADGAPCPDWEGIG